MMDNNKWVDSLPRSHQKKNFVKNKLDPEIWVNTLPKTDILPQIKKNNSFRKYALIATTFVIGLIFVSIIKNETRSLQKELDNLFVSINLLKFELHQATLDHEVITSPENISRLAKENLEFGLIMYKKSQIKELKEEKKLSVDLQETQPKNSLVKKNNKQLKEKIKIKVAKKIEAKKVELRKMQELYSNPEKLPKELKVQVVKKIEKAKSDLKNLYNDPRGTIQHAKLQRWAALQVVKVLVGIPIVPGK